MYRVHDWAQVHRCTGANPGLKDYTNAYPDRIRVVSQLARRPSTNAAATSAGSTRLPEAS